MDKKIKEYQERIWDFLNSYKEIYNIKFTTKYFGILKKEKNFKDYIIGIHAINRENGLELILQLSNDFEKHKLPQKILKILPSNFKGTKIHYQKGNSSKI